MKVNLRRAAQYRKAIEAYLTANAPEVSTSVSIFVSTPVDKVIKDAQDKFANSLDTLRALDDILTRLRVAVAKANAEGSVSLYLSRKATLTRQVARLEKLISSSRDAEDKPIEVATAKIEHAKKRASGEAAYFQDEVNVTIPSTLLVEQMKADLRQIKRDLAATNDLLLEANYKGEVEIPDQDMNVLVDLGLA